MHPRQYALLSPGVRNMLSLRMDAAHGTPTVWEKLAALFGGGGAERQAILEGEQRDLTQAEKELVSVFQPLLHSAESTALADLNLVVKEVLMGAGTITSIGSAVTLVEEAIKNEVPTVQQQVADLGKTSLATLVSAVLASLGHNNLPV